jgi:5-formyltetrahydrofolate cyclo-ligase
MKQKLREEFLLLRNKISPSRKKEGEALAFIRLKKMTEGYKNILSYSPLEEEVSVSSFNNYLQSQGRLCFPKIEGESFAAYEVSHMESQLKTFSHRFLEPDNSCKKNENIDLVLVPGILFDKSGGRIGFGKGYYDKYLENKKIKTIGVLFKEQLYDGVLPLEKHDIKMESLCIV